MKLLFDQNLSYKLCRRLADVFPDSSHVRLLGLDQAGDGEIWEYARDNQYTIVSLDADFGEMATVLGAPPHVVWLRCGNQSTSVVEKLLRENSARILELVGAGEAACVEVY